MRTNLCSKVLPVDHVSAFLLRTPGPVITSSLSCWASSWNRRIPAALNLFGVGLLTEMTVRPDPLRVAWKSTPANGGYRLKANERLARQYRSSSPAISYELRTRFNTRPSFIAVSFKMQQVLLLRISRFPVARSGGALAVSGSPFAVS